MSATCKDCGIEFYAASIPPKMVMLKDNIWLSIANMPDILCDTCIEKRLGRNIEKSDLKPSSYGGEIPCNQVWLDFKTNGEANIEETLKKGLNDFMNHYNIQGINFGRHSLKRKP